MRGVLAAWMVAVVVVLVGLFVGMVLNSIRADDLDLAIQLQEARILQLEQSELQMRGQWQPPDTVFVERGQ